MSETVRLVYTGAYAVVIPDAAGVEVEPGATVPIPAELAASLLDRSDWSLAEKKAPKKERE